MVRRGVISALLCALVVVPGALGARAVTRPPVTWGPSGGHNFTPALHRKITTIVIHVTDADSLPGTVSWLVDDVSQASAHYVISRDGSIVQLVPLHDIAWHSGNSKVNAHSIGIEHVGVTDDPAGFPAAEYKASAHLVAWLVRRYDIPIDRTHIIGHYQVPDPNHPGEFGGADHHTDPGKYWKWGYYMNLVRRYAFPPTLHISTSSIGSGSTLSGIVPWQVTTKGAATTRVDFLIDGKLVWSDARAPFSFAGGRGWNTTRIANGTHVLTIRATGPGVHASAEEVVHVANRSFSLTTSALRSWQRVKGVLRIRANAVGARSTGLSLYVDGKVWSRDKRAPYTLRWDTRRVHDGLHVLTVAAVSVDGRVAERRLDVVVSNHVARKKAAPKPKPAPAVPPRITAENLAVGQAVSGVVAWRAHTTGPVARLDYLVDGTVVGTQTSGPWALNWDSSTVAPGTHVLELKATARSGTTAVRDVTVTVSAG